jgi:hypothetical protein
VLRGENLFLRGGGYIDLVNFFLSALGGGLFFCNREAAKSGSTERENENEEILSLFRNFKGWLFP